MNQKNSIQEQNVVSLRSMFFYVLKKWKILLLLFVVGALIGSGYSYQKKVKTTKANKVESRIAKLQKLIDSGDTDSLDVEKVLAYKALKEAYEEAVEEEKSDHRLMGDDKAWTATQVYYMTTVESNRNAVQAFLSGMLKRNDRLVTLYSQSGSDWTYDEFVSTLSVSVKFNDIALEDGDILTPETFRDGTFTMRVWALEEETAKKYMEILDSFLEEANGFINEYYASGYSMILTTDTTIYGESSTIVNLRAKRADARAASYANMKEAASALTENEKLYYQIYYGTYKEKKGSFSKKWPAAGALGMTVIGIFVLFLSYLNDSRLKTEDDISVNHGQKVLAVLPSPNRKKGLTGLFERWEERGRLPANDYEYMDAALRLYGGSGVIISGDPEDEAIVQAVTHAEENNSALVPAGPLRKDAQAVKQAAEAECVVFVVHLNKTRKKEFERELEIAESANIPVTGVVAIR